MKTLGIFLSFFGIIIILFPEFLSYLIGGFFLFVGLNIVLFNFSIKSFSKNSQYDKGDFIKFGKYKIFK